MIIGKFITFTFIFISRSEASVFFDDIRSFKDKSIKIENQAYAVKTAELQKLSKSLYWTPDVNLFVFKNYQKINDGRAQGADHITTQLQFNIFNAGADLYSFKWQSLVFEKEKIEFKNVNYKTEVIAANLILNNVFKVEEHQLEKKTLLLKEETLKILNGRYAQGKIPLQEVLKAKLDYNQQFARVRSSEVSLKEHAAEYRKNFIDEIKTEKWPFGEKVSPKINLNSNSLDFELQKLNENMGEAVYRKKMSGHFPTIDFTLKYDRSPISKTNQEEWAGIFTITIPIWSKLETVAGVKESYNNWLTEKNKSRENLRIFEINKELLKVKIDSYRKNLIEAKDNLKLSQEIYQDFTKIFRNGKISFNDLVIEQNRLIFAEVEYSKSQLDFHRALIDFCYEMGESVFNCFE